MRPILKKREKSVRKLSLFSLSLALLAQSYAADQDPLAASIKKENAPYNEALKTLQTKKEQENIQKMQGAASTHEKGSSPSVMIIDPQTRATDFKEAFSYMATNKAGSLIYIELENQEKVYGVFDLTIMKGGSLVILKMNTTLGQKYRVIKTENLVSIGTD